ncbi:hypothetical protein Ahy_B01g051830 [Arachis hypogaea]|uniref:Transposase Tnp1/En/Spm-like domain-containing protein n=1 Tax=Arachis hypogaea TaxID=3818 RepID=A0A445AN48_ARAHY|nr:hypothetical protein Ahy_B01g051830 [Arachis hypogaea]
MPPSSLNPFRSHRPVQSHQPPPLCSNALTSSTIPLSSYFFSSPSPRVHSSRRRQRRSLYYHHRRSRGLCSTRRSRGARILSASISLSVSLSLPLRVFYYEDDAGEKIKRDILKRIRKNWKDSRHHLFHRCYKQIRTYEKNLQHHPKGIDKNDWKKFVDYRLNEETQKKCKQNTLNRSKQLYTHTGGSKTLARKKDEVEREQGRPVSRGELFIMTHKKRDGSYIHPDARVVSEAIANVERQDGSSKHISQNDSLAQVLGKEHPGRVRVLGAGPCPTQVFGNAAGQPSGSAESNAEDKRMIAELTAKLEEERAKRQSINKVLGYVVQQLGGNLPAEIAEELTFVGGTPDSSCAGPFSSGNHNPQQKS